MPPSPSFETISYFSSRIVPGAMSALAAAPGHGPGGVPRGGGGRRRERRAVGRRRARGPGRRRRGGAGRRARRLGRLAGRVEVEKFLVLRTSSGGTSGRRHG